MENKQIHFQITKINGMVFILGPTPPMEKGEEEEDPELQLNQTLDHLIHAFKEAGVEARNIRNLNIFHKSEHCEAYKEIIENYFNSRNTTLHIVATTMEPLIQIDGVALANKKEWQFIKEHKFWLKTAIFSLIGISIPILIGFLFLYFSLKYE
ncbi:Rid family hydrolase [Paenibacillus sp. KN14-4R]|uniref:Rid family hydrolase n=1 Tax=Paenibacillus sp. KN14-4R TaxID=3445773 RepID=UPI003F9F0A28